MSERAGEPGAPRDLATGAEPLTAGEGDEDAVVDPTDAEVALADAIAVMLVPRSAVLVIGSPLPGLGHALAGRQCTVAVLSPPGRPAVEPWVNEVGTIDLVRPDAGALRGFDAIVAPDLLDLAADPAASLRRIVDAMGPAGRVVLAAGRPAPPGALHRHDASQVIGLCELAGLEVRSATAVTERQPVEFMGGKVIVAGGTGLATGRTVARCGSASVVVAGVASRSPRRAGRDDESARATPTAAVTVAVDRRLRVQQARIHALEDEVRALRATVDRPPRAVAALARLIRTRMRTRA